MYVLAFISRSNTKDEWQGTLDKLEVPYFKLQDENNHWYLQDYWKHFLLDFVKEHGSPALTFGGSMGGWAALYFQPILKSKRILAFSPQTTTIPEELRSFGQKGKNGRWARDIEESGYLGCQLPLSDNTSTIYYPQIKKRKGSELKNDGGHLHVAKKLGYKNIIQLEDTFNHNTATTLKERGQLLATFKSHIDI